MHTLIAASAGGLALGYGLGAQQNMNNNPPTISASTAFIVAVILFAVAFYFHQRG